MSSFASLTCKFISIMQLRCTRRFTFLIYYFLMLYFFFSSRRRHTRCLSDWSSDVCSSDLAASVDGGDADFCERRNRTGHGRGFARGRGGDRAPVAANVVTGVSGRYSDGARSEERRVGKECRSRGSSYQSQTQDKRSVW